VRIEVLFHHGQRRQISSSELADYITERGKPQNKKGVQEVDIAYPSEYLKDGVRISDTPGVGSMHSHNTEVAYKLEEGHPPGVGKMMGFTYTLYDNTFEANWEIIP
jgi:hypothetical protein